MCTADAACIEAEQPDILILDIEMLQKSSIEIKNELTKGDRPSNRKQTAWGNHAVKVYY